MGKSTSGLVGLHVHRVAIFGWQQSLLKSYFDLARGVFQSQKQVRRLPNYTFFGTRVIRRARVDKMERFSLPRHNLSSAAAVFALLCGACGLDGFAGGGELEYRKNAVPPDIYGPNASNCRRNEPFVVSKCCGKSNDALG
ncbi:hypothetical protein AVEN_118698-1 [Araneus ventricosus]|uniref:Uncharacterized protein n=1 Tax=Araneus ventricosus TaxID=182803 RepID=A0A4Y2AZ36_ARAVE|nr:hypothetical protein AVEN_118698-1 [Araneus ventricosus]